MRMWMCNPLILCKDHILGEHLELHMLEGSIKKNKNLGRFLTDKLVDPSQIQARHDILVQEFARRGYPSGLDHKTPLHADGLILQDNPIDTDKSLQDLLSRCEKCRERYKSLDTPGNPTIL